MGVLAGDGITYDRDSDRLYRKNLVDAAFSELYHANGSSEGYDLLSQLTAFRRGTLSDSNSDSVPDTVTTASRSQVWDFDALGNWDTLTSDSTDKDRTHNKQNQITSIESQTTPAYDANGNMTTDESNKTLIYDAWNHLVQYKNGTTVLVSYTHDALGRRVTRTESSTTTDLYYTAAWQVLEERVSGTARVQYVWSPVYVDAMIERDRDTDSNGSLEERLYVQQDANYNVTALISTSGSVLERFVYDPYGQATVLTASWGSTSGSSYAWVYLHQGGRFDPTTGLYNFRNREDSPTQGRWAQRDPIEFGAGDVNLYRYAGNDPIRRLDPLGLLFITPSPEPISDVAIGAAIGVVEIVIVADVAAGVYVGTVVAEYTTVPLAEKLFNWWYKEELARIRQPIQRKCDPEDKRKKKEDKCQEQFEDDDARCAKIAREMREFGYDNYSIARFNVACQARASGRKRRCERGEDPPTLEPYPAPWE